MDEIFDVEPKDFYVQADLEDHADLQALDNDESEYGYGGPSRSGIIQQALGLSDHEVRSINHGSYQGTLLFLFESNGYIWLLKDSYGSCSYCDGLLASDHAGDYARTMFRNAYAFDSVDDAQDFLRAQEMLNEHEYTLDSRWSSFAEEGIGRLEDLR